MRRLHPKHPLLLAASVSVAAFCLLRRSAPAAGADTRLVRLAEIDIDPAYLERYRTALTEEIRASIRNEPGVLTLDAVSVKGQPSRIRIFEIYASPAAYQAHLQTPHFRKYKTDTQGMVKSLHLIETDPIVLASK